MEKALSLEFLRVVERAAIASAHTMGLGDRHKSDQVAVEAMRAEMDTVGMDGTIVIGEGERDEAPMLFIGEKVGAAVKNKNGKYPEVVIAVDPLEGTNLCATGEPNAIVVLASRAACSTRPISTWKRLSSARPAKAPWNSMLPLPITSRQSPSD